MRLRGRVFLANVGANASHRFAGPLFPDGTFEFLPIPEDRDLTRGEVVRYRDLRAFNRPGGVLEFVPPRLWDWPAHADPEFDTFTYGDVPGANPRAAALRGMGPGDLLFFLSRLMAWPKGKPNAPGHGFYLVGFLEVDDVLAHVSARPGPRALQRFGANAHVRRALAEAALWDGFWVFAGSPRSRRFRRAVPVTRDVAERLFTAADGSPWRWSPGRSELQVIGSYTRSCRCVIDPGLPGQEERLEALWDWVGRHA